MIQQPKEVFISKLVVREPFQGLFPIEEETYREIKKSMRNGYDPSKPVDVWKQEGVVLDGNTRVAIAKDLKIRKITIYEHSFPDEESALTFAILNQKNRRNLSKDKLFSCIERVDKLFRSSKGGSRSSEGHSDKKTAKVIGVDPRTIRAVRSVLDYGDDDIKNAARDGKLSIKNAEKIAQAKRAAQEYRPIFNSPNDNIEWAKWSWNPVTGCLHNCEYCYARDIANRFYKEKFKPQLWENRLEAPQCMKVPDIAKREIGYKNVFVCSMADLFGSWVNKEWILRILEQVRNAPQWNFLFLTKNPKRYLEFEFPKNAWLGATVDYQKRINKTEEVFSKIKATVKFLSCEPMMEKLEFPNLKIFDWIIIGSASESSKTPEFQPKWEWVESLILQARKAKCMVYFKPNLKSRPMEYPENV